MAKSGWMCWLLCAALAWGCEKRAREEGDSFAGRAREKRARRAAAGALVESRHIKLEGQSSLYLKLEYAAGYLDLEPDTAGALAEVRLEFETEEDRPEILFDSTSAHPSLKIRSNDRRREGVSISGLRENQWRLKISPLVALDLQLEAGAVHSRLDFSGMKLENLSVEIGAGELDFMFDRPNAERPRLRINAGAAATTGRGLCNANFSTFEFKGGAGKSDLTFDGPYAGEGRVDLQYGVGLNTVFLAQGLGVKIRKFGSFLAPMSLHGFEKAGEVYYSTNFEQAQGRLEFDIKMGVGHTTVKWLD